jgi:hypothetical protein
MKHAEVARTRSAVVPMPASTATITSTTNGATMYSGRRGMLRCASPASQIGSAPSVASEAASLAIPAR